MMAFYSILAALFVLVCLFMILMILIQKGRGGGLSSSFGGGGGGHTAFGSKTGDVLTWATTVAFGLFLLLAIGLNLVANRVHANRTGLTPNAGIGLGAVDGPADPDSTLPDAPVRTEPGVPPPAGAAVPADVTGDAEVTGPAELTPIAPAPAAPVADAPAAPVE